MPLRWNAETPETQAPIEGCFFCWVFGFNAFYIYINLSNNRYFYDNLKKSRQLLLRMNFKNKPLIIYHIKTSYDNYQFFLKYLW